MSKAMIFNGKDSAGRFYWYLGAKHEASSEMKPKTRQRDSLYLENVHMHCTTASSKLLHTGKCGLVSAYNEREADSSTRCCGFVDRNRDRLARHTDSVYG